MQGRLEGYEEGEEREGLSQGTSPTTWERIGREGPALWAGTGPEA